MEIRYISDMHFGHKNIVDYDNRPFRDVEHMEEELIRRWNSVVKPEDHTYILGDFCWGKESHWLELLPKLNGQKTLIRGNHDIDPQKSRKSFADVKEYKVIEDNGRKVVLCHYPIPCFRNHYYGWFHVYGHVHTSYEWGMMERTKYLQEELYSVPCHMYNAGAMLPYMDYTPKTLDEIIAGYTQWKGQINEQEEKEGSIQLGTGPKHTS